MFYEYRYISPSYLLLLYHSLTNSIWSWILMTCQDSTHPGRSSWHPLHASNHSIVYVYRTSWNVHFCLKSHSLYWLHVPPQGDRREYVLVKLEAQLYQADFSMIWFEKWTRATNQWFQWLKKKSTTPSCNGPIPAQKIQGNSVPGTVFSHTMPKMDFYYSHRFSWG